MLWNCSSWLRNRHEVSLAFWPLRYRLPETHCKKYSPSASARGWGERQLPTMGSSERVLQRVDGTEERTVVMTEVLDALEVGETADAAVDKLAHRQEAVAVLVEPGQDGVDNLVRLLRVDFEVLGALAFLFVVDAVDRLDLVPVEDPVAVQVVQVEEGLNVERVHVVLYEEGALVSKAGRAGRTSNRHCERLWERGREGEGNERKGGHKCGRRSQRTSCAMCSSV